MSDPRVRWRVKVIDDKSVRYELMVDGVKMAEQSAIELLETLLQGQSSIRWSLNGQRL